MTERFVFQSPLNLSCVCVLQSLFAFTQHPTYLKLITRCSSC